LAYPLSLRDLEEMMAERGVSVDQANVHSWAIKIVPVPAAAFRRRKRQVGTSWRMDKTYITVHGQWKYLYRAMDRESETIDFLLSARRDVSAARRFLEEAIALHGEPEKITIDKSGANAAAIESYNAKHRSDIELRQCKHLNNIVEQDHQAIKTIVRPMLGLKVFRCACILMVGVETMRMIRKGQRDCHDGEVLSAADQFYPLAF
jgi:putative transposase